jgi:D-glycero-D-manno-heptose 1,7-bisphosphate phosphatase
MSVVTATYDAQTGRANSSTPLTAVFLDLDTVLLSTHRGRYGPELNLQADVAEAIDRFSEAAQAIVVLVDPPSPDSPHAMDTANRLEVLRKSLGATAERLIIAVCSHGEERTCECAKPSSGLIEQQIRDNGLAQRGGWYVGGDQEGVVAGRGAGLKTIRIGPVGEDHLSAVHRADYEARDLLDAANHILFEALAA